MARNRRWRDFTWFLGGCLVGVLMFALFAGSAIYDYRDTIGLDSLPEVDAIVCLAGGRGRIAEASLLWHRYFVTGGSAGRVPALVIIGMGPKADWSVFASQVSPEVLSVLPRDRVILETVSTSTEENARWFKSELHSRHWRSYVLVTASYHMRRASAIFSELFTGEDVRMETHSFVQSPFTAREWKLHPVGIEVSLTEYIKWLYYKYNH